MPTSTCLFVRFLGTVGHHHRPRCRCCRRCLAPLSAAGAGTSARPVPERSKRLLLRCRAVEFAGIPMLVPLLLKHFLFLHVLLRARHLPEVYGDALKKKWERWGCGAMPCVCVGGRSEWFAELCLSITAQQPKEQHRWLLFGIHKMPLDALFTNIRALKLSIHSTSGCGQGGGAGAGRNHDRLIGEHWCPARCCRHGVVVCPLCGGENQPGGHLWLAGLRSLPAWVQHCEGCEMKLRLEAQVRHAPTRRYDTFSKPKRSATTVDASLACCRRTFRYVLRAHAPAAGAEREWSSP